MVFKRVWDSSCPRVWDKWEADGKTWVVQDLPPEDDEKAIKLLIDHLCVDEVLCAQQDLVNDPESVENIRDVWKQSLARRTSLACYMEADGQKTLVALNCCMVACKDDHDHPEIKGKAWIQVYDAMEWMETHRTTAFDYLGVDKFLTALGLVVAREYRGARLGARLLNAREPLSRSLGLKGTGTVFTGPASQKLAASCGFDTVFEATWSDLADAGMDYPRTNKVVKFMVKKYLEN